MSLGGNIRAVVTMAVFALLYLACSIQFPFMFSAQVAGNLLTDSAFLGVLAVGMTVVILSGGIDLSVGAVVAFVGVLLALMIGSGVDPFVAFTLALVIGSCFGALIGAAIHFLQAPPFIVTLAAMFLARGACFLLTTDSIPINHPAYAELGTGSLGLSISAWAMLLIFAGGSVLLLLTRFGADVRAIGGDARAAELMGVRIGRTTVAIYAFSGLCAALAGILFSVYTQSAHSLAGVGLELDAIAAVVIGGTLLSGGYGTMLGTFFGVMILGLIQSYITFTGTLSSWWAKIATGMLLLVFVIIQQVSLSLSAARTADGHDPSRP